MKTYQLAFALFCLLVASVPLMAQPADCDMRTIDCDQEVCDLGGSSCDKAVAKSTPAIQVVAQCGETGSYNCHQYVKGYYMFGNSGTWVPNCSASSPNDCLTQRVNYQDIATMKEFIHVNSTCADAIRFSCDHSAVQYAGCGGFQLISKDGPNGPLITHSAQAYNNQAGGGDCSPGSDIYYYKFVGELRIPGVSSSSPLTSSKQIGLMNRVSTNLITAGSGVSYSWSATPSNLVSFSCTDCATPTITPTGTGKVWISVAITGDADAVVKTQCVEIPVLDPADACFTVNGTVTFNGYSTSLSSYHSVFAYTTTVSQLNASNAVAFNWVKTGGTGTFSTNWNGTSGTIYLPVWQGITIRFEALNSDGIVICSRTTTFQRSSGWRPPSGGDPDGVEFNTRNSSSDEQLSLNIYPNPATEFVEISARPAMSAHSIKISDGLGRLVETHPVLDDYLAQQRLDVAHLPPGMYFAEIVAPGGAIAGMLRFVVE